MIQVSPLSVLLIAPCIALYVAPYVVLYILLMRTLKRVDANVNEILWKA